MVFLNLINMSKPLTSFARFALIAVTALYVSACQYDAALNGETEGVSTASPGGSAPLDTQTSSIALQVNGDTISFSQVVSGKSDLVGTSGALGNSNTESYSAALSLYRNGTLLLDHYNVTAYCNGDGSFFITIQNVKEGDFVVMTVIDQGPLSTATYYIYAALSASADQGVTVSTTMPDVPAPTPQTQEGGGTPSPEPTPAPTPTPTPEPTPTPTPAPSPPPPAATKVMCLNGSKPAGAWESGSCTGAAINLLGSADSSNSAIDSNDPLSDLDWTCICSEGCDDPQGWTWGNSNTYNNIQFITQDDSVTQKKYHILSVREEQPDGLLADWGSTTLSRTLDGALSTGTYKLAFTGKCRMTEDGSNGMEDLGSCTDDYTVASVTETSGGIIQLGCNDKKDGREYNLVEAWIPHYAEMQRYEQEFLVPPSLDCTNLKVTLKLFTDPDYFEYRALGTSNACNASLSNACGTTNALFRSYFIDDLSLAPLAIGKAPTAVETEKGLADYFHVLAHCNDGHCGNKRFDVAEDGIIKDPYNTNNSVYLVGGASPYLVRKNYVYPQDGGTVAKEEIGVSYEVRHAPGGDPNWDQNRGLKTPYFFISKRSEEVRPWTVPTDEMIETASDGMVLEQENSGEDTVRAWFAVRNPSESDAFFPQFKLPANWNLYAVVQLPMLLSDSDYNTVTQFTIMPDHLVKCTRSGESVTCINPEPSGPADQWTVGKASSRSYILEIPRSNTAASGDIVMTNTGAATPPALRVSVKPVTFDKSTDHAKRKSVLWSLVPDVELKVSDLETVKKVFEDFREHGMTDILTSENKICYLPTTPPTEAVSSVDYCVVVNEKILAKCEDDTPCSYQSKYDLNHNGVMDYFIYYPMTKVSYCADGTTTCAEQVESCVPDSEHLGNGSNRQDVMFLGGVYDNLLTAAALYGIKIDYAMNFENHWNWALSAVPNYGTIPKQKNGDGSIDPFAYRGAEFYQSVPSVDIDGDKVPDWNIVKFSDDTYKESTGEPLFAEGDIVTWTTDKRSGWPLARVAKVESLSPGFVLYLDVPFPPDGNIPRSGSLYKLHREGYMNLGINLATLKDTSLFSLTEKQLSDYKIGVCSVLKGNSDESICGRSMCEINYPKVSVNWSMTGSYSTNLKITAQCSGADGCMVDPMPTPAQKKFLDQFASDVKKTLASKLKSYPNAIGSLMRVPTHYDETWAFYGGRGVHAFEGFGQAELLGLADSFRRAGFSPSNSNRSYYFAYEHAYLSKHKDVRGISYPAIVEFKPASSAYSNYLLEWHRDKTDPNGHQAITYSGGYGANAPLEPFFHRYLSGLRLVRSHLTGGRSHSNLIWGYESDGKNGNLGGVGWPAIDDADYLTATVCKNELTKVCDYQYKDFISRYVALRDHLRFGFNGYSVHYGLVLPPLSNNHVSGKMDGTGDENIIWNQLLEGMHDARIVEDKVATAKTSYDYLQALAWPVAIDLNYSTCALNMIVAADPAKTPPTAEEIRCFCGDYTEMSEECNTSTQ